MPAGSTYTPIATTTLGSAAASYTFSSIPSTYTDLIVVQRFPNDAIYGYTQFRFNSDSGTNYSFTYVHGYSTATSGRESNQTSIRLGTSSFMSNALTISHIQNYSNSTTNKTLVSRGNFGESSSGMREVDAVVGLWRSTSAITSVTLLISSGTYPAGSTFTLYGIASA